mgnify:CR=1 FL=1
MKIVYLFDIVCPWCFIGKKYFDNISNEIRSKIVEITWQPYFLNPDFGIEGVLMVIVGFLRLGFTSESKASIELSINSQRH